MRKIVINKNRHYPFPFVPFGLPIRVRKNEDTVVIKQFMFDKSCMFDLKDADQGDVNKLFGFSIGKHHHTSFRFGWRPLLSTNSIEIVAYEYHDGIRQETLPIGTVSLNKWYSYKLIYSAKRQASTYKITKSPSEYSITTHDVKLKKASGWGYTLRPYFGGNEKAPQKIIIYRR